MSDDELDREWKPNGRPQSTMARSFSLALNDVFRMDDSIADLDRAVDERRKTVLTQESELEALERQLRATEERLKLAATNKCPNGTGTTSPRHRAPLHQDAFGQSDTSVRQADLVSSPTSPGFANRPGSKHAAHHAAATGKPDHGYGANMPGRLPPTPGASEGEDNGDSGRYH